MLPAAIKQPIVNILRKERKITTPTELDSTLLPTLIFQLPITKPKEASLLHHIRVDTPAIIRTLYEESEEILLNILMYVQTVGLVSGYHLLDIDLLAEAAVKHYFWKPEHNFKGEKLDLRNSLSKELKHPFVNRQEEPPWIARA